MPGAAGPRRRRLARRRQQVIPLPKPNPLGKSSHGIPVCRTNKKARPALDVGRSLTEDQCAFVLAQLDALPPTSAHQRLQVALPLLHATGLRLSEVVAATTGHLEWVSLPRPGSKARIEGWWLEVLGKGNKLRRVPVPPGVIARLGTYLLARGLQADPNANRVPGGVALLGHTTDLGERAPWAGARTAANPIDPAAGISAVTLAKQIKGFLTTCAGTLRLADPRGADRLEAASTHWLRHTHISHALAAGAPLEVVQQNAGHASLDTTTRYVATEAARRMEAMQAVRDAGKGD